MGDIDFQFDTLRIDRRQGLEYPDNMTTTTVKLSQFDCGNCNLMRTMQVRQIPSIEKWRGDRNFGGLISRLHQRCQWTC
jgi:hypothetical protein